MSRVRRAITASFFFFFSSSINVVISSFNRMYARRIPLSPSFSPNLGCVCGGWGGVGGVAGRVDVQARVSVCE